MRSLVGPLGARQDCLPCRWGGKREWSCSCRKSIMWCWSYRVQEISEEEIDSQKPKDEGKEKEWKEEHKSNGREDDTFDDGHDEASDNKQSDYMPAVWHGLKRDVRTRKNM